MKTAGDLLKEKRLLKELSLEKVSSQTKIKLEYLESIENSDFASLPSSTFAKGFLRNYATYLKLNPETIVAMFRRDFTENDKGEIVPRGLVAPVGAKPKYFTVNLILLSLASLTFLGFLSFQLFTWYSYPSLEVLQPQNGDTYGEKITFKGTTDRDATVEVGGQQVIVDSSGNFTLDLIFPSGTHSVVIESTNRQGKTRLLERTFTVSK